MMKEEVEYYESQVSLLIEGNIRELVRRTKARFFCNRHIFGMLNAVTKIEKATVEIKPISENTEEEILKAEFREKELNELITFEVIETKFDPHIEKYDKSIEFLVAANSDAKKHGIVNTQKNITKMLWLCYEKLNEYHLAFDAFKEYDMIKDSIFDKNTQKQIRIVEGKLNMQLKENQIESQKQIIQQQVKILEQEKRNKIYIIVVALLVLGLIIIIYSREKIRRQKERAILIYDKNTRQIIILRIRARYIKQGYLQYFKSVLFCVIKEPE